MGARLSAARRTMRPNRALVLCTLRRRYDGYTVAGALCGFLSELPSPGLVPPVVVDTMARAIELHAANGSEPLLNALREAVSAIGDIERAHFHALLWLLTQACCVRVPAPEGHQ